MPKTVIFILIGFGIIAAGIVVLNNRDPGATAKVKCQFAIEELTALRIRLADVARASVSGDEFNGTVRMPFNAGVTSYLAECTLEHGRFKRVILNGNLLAGI